MTRSTLAACALLFTIVAPAAQSGGSISGVVVSIDSPPQPVRRAIVSVSGGAISSNISVVSDDRGRFIVANLPPGRYTVRASKAAHLTTTYGATRPGAMGTTIAVGPGQKADIRIVLPRGAVISGAVRDRLGQPASGARVSVVPAREVDGPGGYRPSSEELVTDDRGLYRAWGLAPGEYVVSAHVRISRASEIYMTTAEDVDARLRALQQQSGGASVAAAAMPRMSQVGPMSPLNTGEPYAFAPTYYPGTPMAANATRIRVAAGEVREGIDIALLPVRTARVSGTISSGDIPVARLRPTLTRLGPAESSAASPRRSGPDADGAFSFSGVTPGRYTLLVRSGPGALMVSEDERMSTTNNPGVPALFAMQELAIDGADITGLVLTLRPALTLSGRIAFDAATLTPPDTLAGMRVSLITADRASDAALNPLNPGVQPPQPAPVTREGTFTLTGILPGTYSLAAAVPAGADSSKWWLRSAIVNGRDILDHPLEVGGTTSDISGAVLTFTDRRSELAGRLVTATGAPASEFIVVVFPADASYWRPGARRLRSTRPASDGAFSVADLPAGEYLIAALTDIDPDEWQDPDFLRQIVPAGVKVVIRDGEVTRQDLRIAR